jgi:haloalkane dehalogenase
VRILRTPDERFETLIGYPFDPHFAQVGDEGLLMHYVDEGPEDGPVVLLLHGEPSWSYLYRTMIPGIVEGGFRAVAPDLIGFGRSDKPAEREDYTYQRHVDWTRTFIETLHLDHITLFCQDWGGLIGLRIVAEDPDRFDRVIAANTFLPTGDHPLGEGFHRWRTYSQETPDFPVGKIIDRGCVKDLLADVIAGYEAPFPDDSFKAGARQFPVLVPVSPDDPAAPANRAAWEALREWEKPFLTVFGDSDRITLGAERLFQALIPGAKGMPHVIVEGAAHFIQEDKGEELARLVVDFIRET